MNTIQNIPDMSKKYPTVWAYGMPRGWITDRRTNLLLSFSKGKKDTVLPIQLVILIPKRNV